ncbi:N-acetyltransferase [Anaerolentibacter hominis]|uniref:GNAT family N-acetyltransferase n=1 Tax=Anaerolentibacter hominis TaxID=3079009 RepID=UPI0031B88DFB
MIIIRREEEKDYIQIYEMVKNAFATAEHKSGTEQDLVTALRQSGRFIPELALVAEKDGMIVGYALFTRMKVGDVPALTLAPLAVLPGYQRQGVGTRLIEEGHRIAAKLGFELSVLVGSEHYYPRMGYRPGRELGLTSSLDLPDQNFMAIDLTGRDRVFHCTAVFADEFLD